MGPALATFCSQDENDVDNLETRNATNDCKYVSETKENLVKDAYKWAYLSLVPLINFIAFGYRIRTSLQAYST